MNRVNQRRFRAKIVPKIVVIVRTYDLQEYSVLPDRKLIYILGLFKNYVTPKWVGRVSKNQLNLKKTNVKIGILDALKYVIFENLDPLGDNISPTPLVSLL